MSAYPSELQLESDTILTPVLANPSVQGAMKVLYDDQGGLDKIELQSILVHFCRMACLSAIIVLGRDEQKASARADLRRLAPIQPIETEDKDEDVKLEDSATAEVLRTLEEKIILATIATLRALPVERTDILPRMKGSQKISGLKS